MTLRSALLFVTLLFSASPAVAAQGRLKAILEMAERNCPIHLESARPISRRGGLESLESVTRPYTIESGRLTLQTTDPEDAATMKRAIEIYTHPEVMKMSGDYLDAGTVRQIQNMGVASPDQLSGHSMVNLSIRIQGADGQDVIIGFAQLARTDVGAARMNGLVTDPERWFEISYHLHPDFWGKGYASEIASTLIKEAMTKHNAEGVYAQTVLDNNGSGAVLKKAGMVEIGRQKFAGLKGLTGSVYYSITRAQFENPPLKQGANIRIFEKDGQELMALIVVGEVDTWTVVQIDENTTTENMPYAKTYNRFLQLSIKAGAEDERHGTYVSVPKTNPFGGGFYTSTTEIDRLIQDATEEGKLDSKALGFYFRSAWGSNDLRTDLFQRMAALVPANFATLTVFEKKRVYEALAALVARAKGMLGTPFELIILNSSGVDILTRKQIVAQKKQ